MALEDRFGAVSARCSDFARELLSQLQGHPQLAEVLDQLEKIEGKLFRSDIDSALSALRKGSDSG